MNLLEPLLRWKAIEGLLKDLNGMFDPSELPGVSERLRDCELSSHSSQQWNAAGRKE